MIDWHSHVLPGMDDGSRDADESIAMIAALKSQGADHVIATPHFYANDESVDEFLNRREESFAMLREKLTSGMPRILCGAEVRYYPGIGRMSNLERLKIEDTDLLLLEMPMGKWTEYTLKELTELSSTRNITVLLAHIERYLSMQRHDVWERLLNSGILMQVNSGFFNGFLNRYKALRLLANGMIHFIGSDCHNMTTRAPNLCQLYELIERKFGEDFVYQMNEYGYSMLKHK